MGAFQRQFKRKIALFYTEIPVSFAASRRTGGVAERLNATVLKTVVG